MTNKNISRADVKFVEDKYFNVEGEILIDKPCSSCWANSGTLTFKDWRLFHAIGLGRISLRIEKDVTLKVENVDKIMVDLKVYPLPYKFKEAAVFIGLCGNVPTFCSELKSF